MGGQVAALSVDDPTRAEAMHAELQLNFPVLCDSQREVITAWGLLNRGEKGGYKQNSAPRRPADRR